MADTKQQPAGQPDYGNNHPTGGTKENTGKLNPQGPTSGTENMNPNRKYGQQTTAGDAKTDTDQGADQWAERTPDVAKETTNFATGAVSPNAGDVQDESGNLDPATPGTGVGNTQGQHSFRCADAGFADCRWETSMASSDQLWSEIERHASGAHGVKSLDERTRGKIQDAIHVRRAA